MPQLESKLHAPCRTLPSCGARRYRTLAHAAGITETDGRLLLDQKVPGISGVYIQERALFTHLQDQQEHMSHYVMGLCASESQQT